MPRLTETPAWRALQTHHTEIAPDTLREFFAADSQRFTKFSLRQDDLLLDYSKNRVTEKTMGLLFDLAREADVEGWRAKMFACEPINSTENRAVLHVALRNRSGRPMKVDGADVTRQVNEVLAQMKGFCQSVHRGDWRGAKGDKITDIVNIGIGGSDLGPLMAVEALAPYRVAGITSHFVSNVDASHLHATLKKCKPETTLFIVASKTFTTQETLANARTARSWLTETLGDAAVAKH